MPERALPDATPIPCRDCPWRREGHPPGWLGPYTAEDWIAIACSETPIACHLTIKEAMQNEHGEMQGDWDHPAIRQCRGMASFRANIGKSPRDAAVVTGPPSEDVFNNFQAFLDYHNREDQP